ncbi:MAG TPA: universal stress protein [Terriglobales bacterium]|nr:universal stress protein [Terriglobales bacterium]
MIKTILLGIDGSQHALNAEEYALWLGQRMDATVVGLHVVDIVSIEGSFFHDISGSLGFEPYFDLSSKMREALTDRGQTLLTAYQDRAAAKHARIDSVLAIGVVANELADRAKTADLVVIGNRGSNEKYSTGLLGSTAESIARKSPKPVLVVPAQFRTPTKALLAYDGSQRAAAAMQTAAECCSALQLPLTVLIVCREREAGEKLAAEACKYLASHRLESECVVETGHAPEQIVSFLGRGFDLLFIGAYGHSRIIEMVLGSTTEYVLRNAPCPVFLNR